MQFIDGSIFLYLENRFYLINGSWISIKEKNRKRNKRGESWRLKMFNLIYSVQIGHFRVPKTLTLKTRPSAKPFKMSFICMIIKSIFHEKGFALGLVLKQRLAASRKWPIPSLLDTIKRNSKGLYQGETNVSAKRSFLMVNTSNLVAANLKTSFWCLAIHHPL